MGYLGVQAFFVLSGFLITAILVESKGVMPTRDYFTSFYGRRALRIFPVYYAYLALVALIALPWFLPDGHSGIAKVDRFYNQLPWAATYTYNFYHMSENFRHTHLLSHFWSLAVEEQFYLVWPLAIFFIPAHRIKHFLLALIMAGPAIRLMTGLLVNGDAGLIVYVSPFSHLDAFAAGGLFALYGKGGSLRSIPLYFMMLLLAGLLSSVLFEDRTDWWGLGYSNFMQHSFKYVWGYTLFNLLVAHTLVTIRDRAADLPRFLSTPALVYLGSISYGLYVFHNAFIWLVDQIMPEAIIPLKILLSFLLTLVCSAASYRWLEKPCLALKQRYFPVDNHLGKPQP